MQQPVEQVRKSELGEIVLFRYPATGDPVSPAWELWDPTDVGAGGDQADGIAERPSADPSALSTEAAGEDLVAEATRRSFEAGREQGFEEGRAAEREAQAAHTCSYEKLQSERAARLAEDFQMERSRYFDAVEHEVVKLALAIAARILRREAQIDPLLLTGVVRVALGQLSASTQVRLRVPAADLDLWKETVAHLPNLAIRPSVVAGEDMHTGDCRLENEPGSVDLGIRAQLGEIERGFFDLPETGSLSGQVKVVAGELAV